MKLVADVTVSLPFKLDFCAKGPDVEPLQFDSGNYSAVLYFPPSMSDGTVGQSFFSNGWAWWTGTSLRLTLKRPIHESEIDIDLVRKTTISTANSILRTFLNSYRTRFQKAEVHPVKVDPKLLTLAVEYENGSLDSLPEPDEEFFYRHIPVDPPLSTTVNATTLGQLLSDLVGDIEPSMSDQFILDTEWLEQIGENRRAEILHNLTNSLTD